MRSGFGFLLSAIEASGFPHLLQGLLFTLLARRLKQILQTIFWEKSYQKKT